VFTGLQYTKMGTIKNTGKLHAHFCKEIAFMKILA